MPVKSYIVFPHEGKKQELSKALSKLRWCEVLPAENEQLLVMVTDTSSDKEEEECLTQIQQIAELDHYTLVSGFEEQSNK